MLSVVRKLERRLLQADGDRIGVLIDLALRHHERGNHVEAVSVALEAVDACDDDTRRRSDALRIIARSFCVAEAHDLAGTVAARAIQDAVTAADPGREARARE